MIIDASAVVAIVLGESERDRFTALILGDEHPQMSAASWLEAFIVIDSWRDAALSRQFDEVCELLGIEVVAVTADQAVIARSAYRDFGKGSGHPAGLNYGDCFSYALMTVSRQPLLFKGDDFALAGVRRVK